MSKRKRKRKPSPNRRISKKGSSEMVKSLTDLPPNILLEILVRLPLKDLLASKCVCKTFLDLTSPNAQFIQLHSSNSPQLLVFQFLEGLEHSRRIRMLDPELRNFDFRPIFKVPAFKSYEILNPYFNRFALVNSCNGLLYFVRKDTRDECSFVCNPVTNQYVFLTSQEVPFSKTRSQWLGFDSITSQFKVLRILKRDFEPILVSQLYDPRSCSYRNVGQTPLGSGHSWDSCSTLVNGVIYWFDSSQNGVVWFDFGKEIFGVVALPPEPMGEQRNKENMSIGVLEGCLAFSYNDSNANRVHIWVMMENQRCWSWRVKVVVHTGKRRLLDGQFKPLQILSNGELLLLWIDKDLVCYDPKKKRFRLIGLKPNLIPEAVVFTPSFVSLKDSMMIDKVLVQHSRPSGCEAEPIRRWKSNFIR